MALELAVGGRQTESFCSAEEADAYIALLGMDTTSWDALETAAKEFRLKLAAQVMDYLPWRGLRPYCGQALCFPRTCQDDVTRYPDEVKQAQAQLAFNLIHRALQALAEQSPDDGLVSASRVTQVSLGGLLSVSFSGDPAKAGTLLDRITNSIQFPVYLALTRYTSQIRGGTVKDVDIVTCSTTTTSTSTTSTTTTSTTSTTETTTTTTT
jgi:hypothetical protein